MLKIFDAEMSNVARFLRGGHSNHPGITHRVCVKDMMRVPCPYYVICYGEVGHTPEQRRQGAHLPFQGCEP